MASGAAQAILAGEGREGVRGLAAGEDDGGEHQSDSCKGGRRLKDVAEMKTIRNAHGRTPRQDQIKIWFLKTNSRQKKQMRAEGAMMRTLRIVAQQNN
jgi:hypothetical protein